MGPCFSDLWLMEKKRKYIRRNPAQMYALMQAYESSGQSIKEFCLCHDLAPSTFSYWRNKYLSKEASGEGTISGGFVSLIPEDVGSGSIRLLYGEVALDFGSGVSVDYLASLVHKLSGRC
jgi:hypothetical protein